VALPAGARAPGHLVGARSAGLAAARGAAHGRDRPVRQGGAAVPDRARRGRRAVRGGLLGAADADPAPLGLGSAPHALRFAAFLPLFAASALLAAACLHYLVEKPFLLLKERI
jgi:hypothetical protein